MDWEPRQLDRERSPENQRAPLLEKLARLVEHQQAHWPALQESRLRWRRNQYREVNLGPFSVLLQHNPSRALSVGAPVDPASIRQRPCFLCSGHLPVEERVIAAGGGFFLCLNPFPIFYPHPVIIHPDHLPQSLAPLLGTMLDTAGALAPEYSCLYNGPLCGASAPDHLHFQAIPRFSLPLEADVWHAANGRRMSGWRQPLTAPAGIELFTIREYGRLVLVFQSRHAKRMAEEVLRWLSRISSARGETGEPLINLLAWREDGVTTLCLFPRTRHRPLNYTREDGPGVMVSPGAIDLGGVVVTPRQRDFTGLNPSMVRQLFADVSPRFDELEQWTGGILFAPRRRKPPGVAVRPEIPPAEPVLEIGLQEEKPVIRFRLEGGWCQGQTPVAAGEHSTGLLPAGFFPVEDDATRQSAAGPVVLEPAAADARFYLPDMIIGKQFHWERIESQVFTGSLILRRQSSGAWSAINRTGLESYLASVISSEMRPDAPLEFLKAHAILSRSWVLAQLAARRHGADLPPPAYPALEERIWHWTDRQLHTDFDLCADDHCQRYQGQGKIGRPEARQAVEETRGLVLWAEDQVVDARFSKCCGGFTESFRTAWGDLNPPGLAAVRCGPSIPPGPEYSPGPDLSCEENARDWIARQPPAHCHCEDPYILRRILPDFDQETRRFYRWETAVSREELESWIFRKTGWNPQGLTALVPLQRGMSGRLCRLLLTGRAGERILGKELEIRRALSSSHLYSSAFIVEPEGVADGLPVAFRFRGAGWGHGAGLCQIGAAVLACRGQGHETILRQYFPAAGLRRLYP